VEREVVQGKRDEEAFNRVFGQSLHYSFFFLLFPFSAFCTSESCGSGRGGGDDGMEIRRS
jgi:hypothetical protein